MWERTEGWAAGLQLAGLARCGSDPRAGPRATGTCSTTSPPRCCPASSPSNASLLVRAAPLERLSGALCDAALQVTGSAEVLAALDRADLFVVALDAERSWYRCHRLLREVLLRERSPEDERAVLCRAAAWFAEHDRLDDRRRASPARRRRPRRGRVAGGVRAWFFERGAAAGFLMLGEQLPRRGRRAAAGALARLRRHHRRAARPGAALARPGYARGSTRDTVVDGWHDPRAAALMMRAVIGMSESASARRGRPDDARRSRWRPRRGGEHLTALHGAGQRAHPRRAVRRGRGRILAGSWRRARARRLVVRASILLMAGSLALSLLELGRTAELDGLLREAGPLADDVERGVGATPPPRSWRCCGWSQARRRYRDGDGGRGQNAARAGDDAGRGGRPAAAPGARAGLPRRRRARRAAIGPPPGRRSPGPARSSTTSRSTAVRDALPRGGRDSGSAGPRRGRPDARARSSRS